MEMAVFFDAVWARLGIGTFSHIIKLGQQHYIHSWWDVSFCGHLAHVVLRDAIGLCFKHRSTDVDSIVVPVHSDRLAPWGGLVAHHCPHQLVRLSGGEAALVLMMDLLIMMVFLT